MEEKQRKKQPSGLLPNLTASRTNTNSEKKVEKRERSRFRERGRATAKSTKKGIFHRASIRGEIKVRIKA